MSEAQKKLSKYIFAERLRELLRKKLGSDFNVCQLSNVYCIT